MNKVQLKKTLDLALKNFLRNSEARNYEELVKTLLIAFENLGCRACIKFHCLFSHFDWFPDNLRSVSDGE